MTSSAQAPILACRGVYKVFSGLTAVDGLNFEIYPGDVLGIGGPNGAGKTTLFDLISGVTPVTSGRIEFERRNIAGNPPHKICAAGLARTFQMNAAFDSLRVLENVMCSAYFGRRNLTLPGLRYDRATKERAEQVLEFVGLADVRDSAAGTLTVIQRKQLMIASALATSPSLLLLDEPVGGLNPQEVDQMTELVRDIHEKWNVTIIIIEHIMRFLVALSNRSIIMHHGQKIYEGEPENIRNDESVVQVYLGSIGT